MTRTIRNFLLVAVAAMIASVALGCKPAPSPPQPRGDVAGACAQLRTLGCPAGQPSPAGKPCEMVLGASAISSARVACVSAAPDCPAAEACR